MYFPQTVSSYYTWFHSAFVLYTYVLHRLLPCSTVNKHSPVTYGILAYINGFHFVLLCHVWVMQNMSELNNDEVTLYIPFRLVTDSIKQIRYVVSIHFGYANSVCNPIVKFSQNDKLLIILGLEFVYLIWVCVYVISWYVVFVNIPSVKPASCYIHNVLTYCYFCSHAICAHINAYCAATSYQITAVLFFVIIDSQYTGAFMLSTGNTRIQGISLPVYVLNGL